MTAKVRSTLTLLVVVPLLLWSMAGMDVTPARITSGFPKAATMLTDMFAHPDWEYWPIVQQRLIESLQIAALGTFLAGILAIPFGVLAARNLVRSPAPSGIGKVLLNAIRTFPEILLAYAFIKGLGLGAFAGVMAVAIHSIGMLGKLYAERIENVDKGAIEALTTTGATPISIFRHCILPEVLPDFVSFVLYRFDLNVRSASVIGIVGAGGIGFILGLQYQAANYPRLGLIVIATIVTVVIVDTISAKIRKRLA